MVSSKWVFTLAGVSLAFDEPCQFGYEDELSSYLNQIMRDVLCWVFMELDSSKYGPHQRHQWLVYRREDASQPPTCSYNSDWANLLCNNQPAPRVYWTAGGFALAGAAI